MLIANLEGIKKCREDDFQREIENLYLLEEKLQELVGFKFYFDTSFEVRTKIVNALLSFDFEKLLPGEDIKGTLDFLSNGNMDFHLSKILYDKFVEKFASEADSIVDFKKYIPEGTNQADMARIALRDSLLEIENYFKFINYRKMAYSHFFQRLINVQSYEPRHRLSALESALKTKISGTEYSIGDLVDSGVINKCKNLIC